MKLLAIETSCDETAAAIVEKQDSGLIKVLGEAVASSEEMHIKTGGIVPEVAARQQLVSIVPVIQEAISKAVLQEQQSEISNINHLNNWAQQNLDAIAVTQGPGLIGSLLVGVETAKAMAFAWEKPLIPVNHLLGHLYANWLIQEVNQTEINQAVPEFPLTALIVSGGHTDLILMTSHTEYKIVGETRDDAAGECFDKCARALGLPYPGGPNIAKLAAELKQTPSQTLTLPRPLLHEDTLDVSFSGLKAAFVRQVNLLKKDGQLNLNNKQFLAYELEVAIAEILTHKVLKAFQQFHPKCFLLAGGVAANQVLRQNLLQACDQHNIPFYKPQLKHCVDNAAMIGAAAIYHQVDISPEKVKADPGLSL